MSKISELIVKRFMWKEKQAPASLFAIQTIIRYNTGKTFDKTYYSEKDLPYSVRDYMSINNLRETEYIEKPGLIDIKLSIYRKEG